ncbi:MAG: RagB/SusD family nutrient uptake outer membrane protein [Bacteroidota bacterium]
MRTRIYKVSGVAILVLLLISCKKDFLEIVPKGKLVASTLKDYDLLMNNPSFYRIDVGDITVEMGDEIAAEQNYIQNAGPYQNAFAWVDVLYKPDEEVVYTSNQLLNLYICNKIINEVTTISSGTAEQRAALQAEAIATRAWINFDLINHYGKPYDEATAASDPGFPIIKVADVNATNFKRNSVKEFYGQIISDLQTAITNLPLKGSFVTRMSRPAAKGLLGKVYLFMGRYQDALTQFNDAFNDLANVASPPTLYNYNDAFATGGAFLPIGFFGPDYPGNNYSKYQESILLKTADLTGFNYYGLVMAPETMNLYGASDLRRNFYGNMHADHTPIPGGLYRKYATYSHVGLELADLLLMRAEARVRTNDFAGAKADVELLRSNRMPVADAGVPAGITSNTDLLKFIIDERTREFAGEGQHWLDMRRLSVDPVFSSLTYSHKAYAADGVTVSQTYQLRPVRFTLKLPYSILQANPRMTDNP